MDTRLLAAVALLLVVTGCGGSDDDGGDRDTKAGATESTSAAPAGSPDGVGEISAADEQVIKANLTAWFLDPRCDLATEEYLIDLDIFADEETTVDEACASWTKNFVTPQYAADDIVYSDLQGEGDRATIMVGSEFVDITTLYELTFVDGNWLLSGDEYTTDGL